MHTIVLSGGVGSRLWPVSRKTHPKPFIVMSNGLSILQNTFLRALDVTSTSIINVTSVDLLFKVKKEWQNLLSVHKNKINNQLLSQHYILEPFGKNTAAAIAMACLFIADQYDAEDLILVMPSDHFISMQDKFNQAVTQAVNLAQQDRIITFGIKPTLPETGYGYIKYSGTLVG